ncbi:MAG: AsmA-like C-terminal domain-containing protein [Ghiorsea sp.]
MFKICLFRGCRIIFMLAVLFVFSVVLLFVAPPNIDFVEAQVEAKLEQSLKAKKVDVSNVRLSWESGPSLKLDVHEIIANKLEINQSHMSFSYRLYNFFIGRFSPELALSGGSMKLNLDVKDETEIHPTNVVTSLQNVNLTWVLNNETQVLKNVQATIYPYGSNIYLNADGITLSAKLESGTTLSQLTVKANDVLYLPESLQTYITGMQAFELSVKKKADELWTWKLLSSAKQGSVNIEEAHFKLPFKTLEANGDVSLSSDDEVSLQLLNVDELHWNDGENFGDFKMQWDNHVLHIEALDGSTSMPLLWSWLWMLGDEQWHGWLNSMHAGRVYGVRATLDLDWQNPLAATPTIQNLIDMKYHVLAKGSDVDIALGADGKFLYHMNGDVLVDEKHLEADVQNTILQNNIATGSGTYRIDWNTLLMNIDAKGSGDVGKLHHFLDAPSAQALQWGEAKAEADLVMQWDAHKTEPNITKVVLRPTEDWHLSPNGIPMIGNEGVAIWDFNRGLDISDMHMTLPWVEGKLSLFLDKNQSWSLQDVKFDGYAPLKGLTQAFVLPIINPTGITKVHATYKNKKWHGDLDLTNNDWDNFVGYDKEGIESLIIPFNGKPLTSATLPIQLEHFSSHHDDFSFDTSILIQSEDINFSFKNVETSAFRGNFKMFMPFEPRLPWKLNVKADYMDKPVLTSYLVERGGSDAFTRPWSVHANMLRVEWENSYAQNVLIDFSSDKQGVGEVSANHLLSGDTDLEQVKATFSLNGHGSYDLHLLEAKGAGQLLQASGSVETLKDGALKWKGLALMGGKFGTLMEQAELDQLFQEGEMSAVFIGQGEFKDGEAWWRKMKGSFKLRVDDGRIMEGGTLTHLLAAISIADLPKYLIFDRGDIVGSGLLYDKLQVEGDFASNKLNIHKLAFLSSALDAGGTGEVDLATGNLDVVLVARPWQNIEAFLSHIPLLGPILTGEDKSLLRKVYHIQGPASDADVNEVKPEDVGLPSSGYLEDLFTPGRWFEPKQKKIKESN